MRMGMRTWSLMAAVALVPCMALAQPPEGRRGPGQGPPPGGPPRGGNALLRALDADRDGILSTEEIAGAVAALKKLDRNEDGQLTMEEIGGPMGPGRPGGPGGPRPGGQGRPDGAAGRPGGQGRPDGAPPRGPGGPGGPGEARGAQRGGPNPEQMFARFDADEDGNITKEEFMAGMRAMQRRGPRGGQGAGPPQGGRRRPGGAEGRPNRPAPQGDGDAAE